MNQANNEWAALLTAHIRETVAGAVLDTLANQVQSGPAAMPFPKYLTRRQAAGILGVDEKTLGRYLKDGRLPCARPGVAECIAAEDLAVLHSERQARRR